MMSYRKIEKNIKRQLPKSSVRFLELVEIEKYKAMREREIRLRNENPDLRISPILLLDIPFRTPALEALSIVDDIIAQESPRAALLSLLNRLGHLDTQMERALEFLLKCFRADFEETELVKREVEKLLRLRSVRNLPYNVRVYKFLINAFLGTPRFPGLLTAPENEEQTIYHLNRFKSFFENYNGGEFYHPHIERTLYRIADYKIRKIERMQQRNGNMLFNQEFYDQLNDFKNNI
jgi:hypothetical protein